MNSNDKKVKGTIEDFEDRMKCPIPVTLLNPVTRKSIKEIELDAYETPEFKGHDGVLNNCFGEGIKKYGHQSGMWEAREGEDWGVWFPKFLSSIDGKPKSSSSRWVNTISDDGLSILEYKENAEGEKDYISNKWFSKDYIRLVFAYIPKKDRYVFMGAFVGNEEASRPFKHVYTRIATKISIVGKPAYILKLMDEDRSCVGGKRIEKAIDDIAPIEAKIKQASQMNVESLKLAAVNHATKNPVKKEVLVKQIYRDPYIAEYAKRRANGICQLCNMPAPFKDKDENPYLESHHIKWLSEGGEDSIYNVAALCPNCHRKMHVVNAEDDIKVLVRRIQE